MQGFAMPSIKPFAAQRMGHHSKAHPFLRNQYLRKVNQCNKQFICRASPSDLAILPWTGDAQQLQALEDLRSRMDASPFANQVDAEILQWFLLDRKLDPEAAEKKLKKMLQWRQTINADSLKTTDVAIEAATGKAYVHPHLDTTNRPVLVIRVARHVIGAFPPESSEQLCAYTLDRALEKLPKDQNTLLGIFDLRGFTTKNADFVFARFLVDAFFTYYPKRVSQVLFVDAPWVFQPAWQVVKPWLRKYAALVKFVSVEELRRDYFTEDTLPEEFSKEPFPRS